MQPSDTCNSTSTNCAHIYVSILLKLDHLLGGVFPVVIASHRSRVVRTGEGTADRSGRVRPLDADGGGPCPRHHDEEPGDDEEHVQDDKCSVVHSLIRPSESPIVVEPHPSVRGHAHECAKQRADQGSQVAEEWNG